MLEIKVERLDLDLPLPSLAREGDAGYDLYARVDARLEPAGGRVAIPTGVALGIPRGFAGFVQPRSGLALRHGVSCLNSPGLIDSGYRGEIHVILVNTDPSTHYDVRRGDRIAQLVIQAVESAHFVAVGEAGLPPAERGVGGFGHSGR